jgi:hypothetical protein
MRLRVVGKLAVGDENSRRRRGRLDSRANFAPLGRPVCAAVIPRSSGAILGSISALQKAHVAMRPICAARLSLDRNRNIAPVSGNPRFVVLTG